MLSHHVPAGHFDGHHHPPSSLRRSGQSLCTASQIGIFSFLKSFQPEEEEEEEEFINDRSLLFAQVTEHVLQLQDYVNTMSKLQVDEHEYAYLKAIALCSPGKEK
jgi:hypothetical protein